MARAVSVKVPSASSGIPPEAALPPDRSDHLPGALDRRGLWVGAGRARDRLRFGTDCLAKKALTSLTSTLNLPGAFVARAQDHANQLAAVVDQRPPLSPD